MSLSSSSIEVQKMTKKIHYSRNVILSWRGPASHKQMNFQQKKSKGPRPPPPFLEREKNHIFGHIEVCFFLRIHPFWESRPSVYDIIESFSTKRKKYKRRDTFDRYHKRL